MFGFGDRLGRFVLALGLLAALGAFPGRGGGIGQRLSVGFVSFLDVEGGVSGDGGEPSGKLSLGGIVSPGLFPDREIDVADAFFQVPGVRQDAPGEVADQSVVLASEERKPPFVPADEQPNQILIQKYPPWFTL